MFACHKLSETSLSLQSHWQLLLPWGRPIEIVWLSERGTLPERTRPAADSCGVIHVRRYAAVICVRTGPCWREASLWNLWPLRLLCRHMPLRQHSLCSSSEARIVHLERGCVVSCPGFLKVAAFNGNDSSLSWFQSVFILSSVNTQENLNVAARRDTSVIRWIIRCYVSHTGSEQGYPCVTVCKEPPHFCLTGNEMWRHLAIFSGSGWSGWFSSARFLALELKKYLRAILDFPPRVWRKEFMDVD